MDMSGMDMSSSTMLSMTSMTSMDMSSSTMDMNMMSSSSSMLMNMMSSMSSMSSSLSSMSMSMSMGNAASTATASTSMAMDMNMGSSSGSTASMTMDMGSSTSTSSSMDMSGDDSMSSMNMNTYFTTNYDDYPVVFKTLHAQTGGAAFGIFCILFFCSFALRGLFFLSAFIEQKYFHNLSNAVYVQDDNCECADEEEVKEDDITPPPTTTSNNIPQHLVEPQLNLNQSIGSILRQLFLPSLNEVGKDIVRLLLAFVIAMFGYALMIAAMSYILLYFFAICLGISFGEVFFNRLSMILGINKNSAICGNFH
ncbi:hypothetical protein B5S32_g4934 [[Candida] boidinii]|nr:hypothetical protein B5S32_g4934 [[Candida] boidinii]